jgi:GT2 family glycosyltransferase
MIISPNDISVVIPVRNNQEGINRILKILRTFVVRPKEVIIVDNNSDNPILVNKHEFTVRKFNCAKIGPAAARNVGWEAAAGKWILFWDSDCVPIKSSILGYCNPTKYAIGYAGKILSSNRDYLGNFYNKEKILYPTPLCEWIKQLSYLNIWIGLRTNNCYCEIPAFLVTANALILKRALSQVGGFDERFKYAAAEDVDLGLRLWEVGNLEYAMQSCVLHDYGGLIDFCKRFYRYGRGNQLLMDKFGIHLHPRLNKLSILKILQFISYTAGRINEYYF